MRFAQGRGGTSLIIFEQLKTGLCTVHQGLGVGHARVQGIEFVPLIRLRGQFVQLRNLPLQAFALALQIVLGGKGLLQALARLMPVLPQHLGLRGIDGAIGVQHGPRGIRAGQTLPCMLTMDIDQFFAQMPELRCGCW